jgi:hypothetical protein
MQQMTGGDKLRARKMRQDFFEFEPTHKIILTASHKPIVRGTDYTARRGIKMVPFTVTIHEDEKDKKLAAKLSAELSGILDWTLCGCLDWAVYDLAELDEVSQATKDKRLEQDTAASLRTTGGPAAETPFRPNLPYPERQSARSNPKATGRPRGRPLAFAAVRIGNRHP